MAKQDVGALPSRTYDVVTLTSNGAATGGLPPYVTGGFMQTPGVYTSTAAALGTAGRVYFTPCPVQYGFSTDTIRLRLTTAQSGGTTSLTAGLYRDDGTGYPDGTAQLGATSAYTLTTIGSIDGTFTAVALQPGMYWVGISWQVTTTPTTAPQFQAIQNPTYNLAIASGTAVGTSVRAYYQTLSALPTTAMTKSSTGLDGNNDVPLWALRRSN